MHIDQEYGYRNAVAFLPENLTKYLNAYIFVRISFFVRVLCPPLSVS